MRKEQGWGAGNIEDRRGVDHQQGAGHRPAPGDNGKGPEVGPTGNTGFLQVGGRRVCIAALAGLQAWSHTVGRTSASEHPPAPHPTVLGAGRMPVNRHI